MVATLASLSASKSAPAEASSPNVSSGRGLGNGSDALVIRDEQSYLAVVREVRSLAERCDTIETAKSLADRATAAKVYAERAKLGGDMVNRAAAAKLWAERRAGELLSDTVRPGNPSQRTGLPIPKLADFGVTEKQSSEWQKLAEIPAEQFEQAVEQAASEGSVSRSRVMAVHYASDTPEWSTPQDLFDALDREFGFQIDVCATAENAKCASFFDAELDGLAQPWSGVCWMNPPYGDGIGAWVRKARESAEQGATVVCLVPARVDTGWWWDNCWQGEVRFIRGRLKFGGGSTGAPFPSAIVIFGRKPNIPESARWKA